MTTSAAAADSAAAAHQLSGDVAGPIASGWAPGRCTLLGDHLDYVGGRVLCCALDAGVAAAVGESRDGRWHVSSGGEAVVREVLEPVPRGDVGDRPLAAVVALRREGVDVPPMSISLAASLPRGAGLASSTAVVCAVMAALLGRSGSRLATHRFAELAWVAEHDIVGVPCGHLDQRAIIDSPAAGVLALDCSSGAATAIPWPWDDVVLVVADNGEAHDVGGAAYRALRAGAEAVLRMAGVASCAELRAADVERVAAPARRRADHLVGEVSRVHRGEAALRAGDAVALGSLMGAAQRAQRDLLGASTPLADLMVAAAEGTAGCHGARLVGAGFGGCVVALCDEAAAAACVAAVVAAAPRAPAPWVVRPAAGLAVLTPEMFDAPALSPAPAAEP